MKQTVIDFFEEGQKADADALYQYWISRPQADALIIGPTRLLSSAGTQFPGIENGKQYYMVIGSSANSKANPAINP